MGRLKTIGSRVASVAPRTAPPQKVADPFYVSAEWREFARAVKRARGFVCENPDCKRDCSHAPRGLIADHIVERSDGGADFDIANVMLLCIACHNSKTAIERTKRHLRPV
jgi:5-methylcytosine-specific restriction protein A